MHERPLDAVTGPLHRTLPPNRTSKARDVVGASGPSGPLRLQPLFFLKQPSSEGERLESGLLRGPPRKRSGRFPDDLAIGGRDPGSGGPERASRVEPEVERREASRGADWAHRRSGKGNAAAAAGPPSQPGGPGAGARVTPPVVAPDRAGLAEAVVEAPAAGGSGRFGGPGVD